MDSIFASIATWVLKQDAGYITLAICFYVFYKHFIGFIESKINSILNAITELLHKGTEKTERLEKKMDSLSGVVTELKEKVAVFEAIVLKCQEKR